MKDASTATFGNKMWFGVHILSHITGKKYGEHANHSTKIIHFLVPLRVMEKKQKQDTELGSTSVHCIFTFLYKLVISKKAIIF